MKITTEKILFLLLLCLCASGVYAQDSAQWITAPPESGKTNSSAVTHYRLRFPLRTKPEHCMVRVTADAVYRLFVNGTPVSSGPASGDMKKWRYDRIDIAPYLKNGDNLLAAVVWYPGQDWKAPVCFTGKAPGFFLQGESDPGLSTGTGAWRCRVNPAYAPQKIGKLEGYFALGDFEQIDGRSYLWGWETAGYDDSAWPGPVVCPSVHNLVPRDVPPLEFRRERLARVRQYSGVTVPDEFLTGKHPVIIPAHTQAVILLDREELSNAYPELILSGGKGASVEMGYAEALFEDDKNKGDRNAVDGKRWSGALDRIIADGGTDRLYRPLWFRTFRYLRLNIQTADEPLTLVDLKSEAVGYPFAERAAFDAGDGELKRIWEVGLRTLRLCAVDNFYDCPYYERLQYTGDTRIEALISVYVSGDDRLMRKAIDLFADSLGAEGLTASRYPSGIRQIIPTFANWWIAMIDDYRMLNGDKEFIRKMVPAMETVLARFEKYTDSSGLVIFSPDREWDFVDWSEHLPHKRSDKGPSGILSLNHVYALDRAAEIMRYLGDDGKAGLYQSRSARIREAVYAQCWNAELGVLADNPGKTRYTEHANILGILTDTIPPARQQEVMRKILDGKPKMAEATIYFRFYYNRALVKTGLADRYLDTLDPWRNQLKLNLTTWAERPEPSRSDCHAWGSSPNYEFLATVAGITPAAPGFARVRIAPALGPLKKISAHMPHPNGMIEVELSRTGIEGISGHIVLPAGLEGTFEWGGKTIALKSGDQTVGVR